MKTIDGVAWNDCRERLPITRQWSFRGDLGSVQGNRMLRHELRQLFLVRPKDMDPKKGPVLQPPYKTLCPSLIWCYYQHISCRSHEGRGCLWNAGQVVLFSRLQPFAFRGSQILEAYTLPLQNCDQESHSSPSCAWRCGYFGAVIQKINITGKGGNGVRSVAAKRLQAVCRDKL